MAFFAIQYQVLFHDTMAYGSHHHMANLKFQNIARETLLFGSHVEDHGWYEELKDIVVLTREAFSFNLAPVGLGEKVGVLMTYEDPSRSGMRLCFRVVREDGQPVSFGYQHMIMIDKDTHHLVPAPRLLTQYLDRDEKGFSLLEDLTDPGFAERSRRGGLAVKAIFPEAICALGQQVAAAPAREGYPRILDADFQEYCF